MLRRLTGVVFAISLVSVSGVASAELHYKAYIDSLMVDHEQEFEHLSLSGQELDYSKLGWIIDGVATAAEVTRDSSYLLKALSWTEAMKAKATVIDNNGYLNWKGSWTSRYSQTPIFQHGYDLHAGRAMARVARLIVAHPDIASTHRERAYAIHYFVKTHVADKWLKARRGSCEWLLNDVYNFGDKASFWGHMLLDLVAVAPNEDYRTEIGYVVHGLTSRLQPFGNAGALRIRDNGGGDNNDTSHANHAAHFAVRAYLDGAGVTENDIKGLAKLLTTVIWNQSLTDPMFTNYTDGSNSHYGRRGPYGNGQIYQGWVRLALVDEAVHNVMTAVLEAIVKRRRNPSLDYNSTIAGKMLLGGNLANTSAVLRLRP